MALDEAIVRAVETGDSPPTVRVYEWRAPSVTIGFSQVAARVLDIDRCRRDGVDVVRRPTGGRAVFHVDDLSYSVAAYRNDERFGGSLGNSFRIVNEVLRQALAMIGIAAEPGGHSSSSTGRAGVSGLPCFAGGTRFEIAVDGKKIVGSARRQYGTVFLQQGTILVGPAYPGILDYLGDPSTRSEYGRALAERSTSLSTVTGGGIDVESLKASIFEAFSHALDGAIRIGEPSGDELKAAERIIEVIGEEQSRGGAS